MEPKPLPLTPAALYICIALSISFNVFCGIVASGSDRIDPVPDPAAVVTSGQARFTILTDHIVRMQYGQSHDEPTFSFINRRLPVPKFKEEMNGEWLEISTSALQLKYRTSSKYSFNKDNLQVYVVSTNRMWKPLPTFNRTLEGNLLGTARTLDHNVGASNMDLNCLTNRDPDLHCTLGVLSQWGYVVIDDTARPRFDHNLTWPWLVQTSILGPSYSECKAVSKDERRDCGYIGIRPIDCTGKGCCYHVDESTNGIPSCFYPQNAQQDLYFFGHGRNYTQALDEFTRIAGKVPMPPRYAFGLLYSRYWAYSDFGEMEVVEQYKEHKLPLDVIISDMDWHITYYDNVKDQAGERRGWTGYTWDKHIFPKPASYLQWCKTRGLKNALNLHPASGIQPWEEKYAEMATAMGIDPATKRFVPFVPENKTFVSNWMSIVMSGLEQGGIDYWWLDWQQGENWINMTGVNPTFWLNYIFYTDPVHWNVGGVQRRGMLMHRFGGLGNHRYQIGFSGDVIPLWDSLDYQVYFTVTASNVAFSYWSHDLGGHVGKSPPELYTRWIAFGTFSPIFRIHGKKGGDIFRRPWLYPVKNYYILMKYFLWRASLVPYIYTSARQTFNTGLGILRPMYYSFPENPLSYEYDRQYMFGDAILVAPVTTPMDPAYNTSRKSVFLPTPLTVVSWQSGEVFHEHEELTRNYTLSEIPVFVKVGSIIPTIPESIMGLGTAQQLPKVLRLMTFIGGGEAMCGMGELYEDDGSTNGYKEFTNSATRTLYSYNASHPGSTPDVSKVQFMIGAAIGTFESMLYERRYEIVLRGAWPASSVSVDGKRLSVIQYDTGCPATDGCFSYDGSSLSVVVTTNVLETNTYHEIDIALTVPLPSRLLQTDFIGRLARLAEAKQILDNQWGIHTVHQQAYPSLLLASSAGVRITYSPQTAQDELEAFPKLLNRARSEVEDLDLSHSDNLKSILLELLS